MGDAISREERQLIDKAIASGMVNKIPRGQSAWQIIEGVHISPGLSGVLRERVERVIARRKAIRQYMNDGMSDAEIAAKFQDVAQSVVYKDLLYVRGEPVGSARYDTPGRKAAQIKQASVRAKKRDERRAKVALLAGKGVSKNEIIAQLSSSWQTISDDLDALGLVAKPAKGAKPGPKGPHTNSPRDRRRFKKTNAPTGKARTKVKADATGTLFPGQVFEVPHNPLRDGKDQRKLGGDVLVGPLKGYRLLHLTLQERVTCPRSCHHWQTCYGNNMQYAKRWRHGPELEAAIADQLVGLMRDSPRGALVRLHTLGDFYSLDYALMWGALLEKHERLSCFGFTAHAPRTEIGAMIAAIREKHGTRFAIRHSGVALQEWGSITMVGLAEPGQATTGKATICPVQRHALEGRDSGLHCGNCGLCWKGSKSIAFMEH